MRRQSRWWFSLLAVMWSLSLAPVAGNATIYFSYGNCSHSAIAGHAPCDQQVVFQGNQSALRVVGDLSPPDPQYDVFVDSLESLTLHASGRVVDTGNQGEGFRSILLTPEDGWAWLAIEFELVSMVDPAGGPAGDPTREPGVITFKAADQDGQMFSFAADYRWEPNSGENQHYHLYALDGQVIVSLQVDYAPLVPSTNRLREIHHINVASARNPGEGGTVPLPGSLALVGLGLAGLAATRRRRR